MQALKRIIALAFASFCIGCATQNKKTTEVLVKVDPLANGGQIFYMVAKPSSTSDFFLDDYQKIAAESLYSKEESSQTKAFLLIPGTTQKFQIVTAPEDTPLAVYFLFTSPSEGWKHCFENPSQLKHKILVEENQIKAVSSY
jgi:predicted component of type VI protein secretion system